MDISSSESINLILQHSLQKTTKELENITTRLSYGKQTRAFENAANLIISESMEADRRGSQQAIENSMAGMNMLSTAESGLSSVNENLQRIRELTLQRRNGTYGDEEKAAIDQEINALKEEIDRVADSTSFNNINLLDGSASDVSLQVGPDSEEETNTKDVSEPLGSVRTEDLGLGDPSDPDFLDQIDSALREVTSRRADIGAFQNGLESTISSLQVREENITSSQSRLIDVDVAKEVSKLTQNQILQNATVSLMAQANQMPQIAQTLL